MSNYVECELLLGLLNRVLIGIGVRRRFSRTVCWMIVWYGLAGVASLDVQRLTGLLLGKVGHYEGLQTNKQNIKVWLHQGS